MDILIFDVKKIEEHLDKKRNNANPLIAELRPLLIEANANYKRALSRNIASNFNTYKVMTWGEENRVERLSRALGYLLSSKYYLATSVRQ